ncbi:MAG: hypothetical protein QOF53_13 [Nocardioidaceae bacterium]|nr:hypothetical protein [Nocardioidaceae bacterium]
MQTLRWSDLRWSDLRWSGLTHKQRTVVLAGGSVQVALAVTAWTDLALRPAAPVNGGEARWAAIIAVNLIGLICYFRRVSGHSPPNRGSRRTRAAGDATHHAVTRVGRPAPLFLRTRTTGARDLRPFARGVAWRWSGAGATSAVGRTEDRPPDATPEGDQP